MFSGFLGQRRYHSWPAITVIDKQSICIIDEDAKQQLKDVSDSVQMMEDIALQSVTILHADTNIGILTTDQNIRFYANLTDEDTCDVIKDLARRRNVSGQESSDEIALDANDRCHNHIMVHTKLERSFDSNELHKILSVTFHKHHRGRGGHKIERPPLPPGSRAFEQTKDEMEIERQSLINGHATLPSPPHPGRDHLPVSCLTVPSSSPMPSLYHHDSCHGPHSRTSQQGDRTPPHLLSHKQERVKRTGRRSPHLELPPAALVNRNRSRSVSPTFSHVCNNPSLNLSPTSSRPCSYKR